VQHASTSCGQGRACTSLRHSACMRTALQQQQQQQQHNLSMHQQQHPDSVQMFSWVSNLMSLASGSCRCFSCKQCLALYEGASRVVHACSSIPSVAPHATFTPCIHSPCKCLCCCCHCSFVSSCISLIIMACNMFPFPASLPLLLLFCWNPHPTCSGSP
jgi:hypothetical protein